MHPRLLLLVAALAAASCGGGSSTGPSSTHSAFAGTYRLTEVGGAPPGTPFAISCGPSAGRVTAGTLTLTPAGEFTLTYTFTFDCGDGPMANEQGGRGTWDASATEIQFYPQGTSTLIPQTATVAGGSLSVDVSIGTNQGGLRKRFVFTKA